MNKIEQWFSDADRERPKDWGKTVHSFFLSRGTPTWAGQTLIPDLDIQRQMNNRLSHETVNKITVWCTIL